MNNNKGNMIVAGNNSAKGNFSSRSCSEKLPGQGRRTSAQTWPAANSIEDELARLRAASAEVHRIRLSAQRELQQVKQLRTEAERYRQQTETKARSDAQLLILQTRLAARKEIAELKRKISEEIQKVLADINMIRTIIAQDEGEAQRKFAVAAKIRALSLTFQKEARERSEGEEEAIGVSKV